MMGLELLAGYAVAYLVRKARVVAKRADAEVDQLLDAGMDRLQELVSGKLGDDPALVKLEQEAREGAERPRTVQRVRLAVEEAAEADAGFAELLEQAVVELRATDPASGVSAGDHGVAAAGDVNIGADRGGVAAGVIDGSVSTGNPRPPGPASA
jgi:hypothetical protein